MRVRLPDVYRAYPTGYHGDLLPWGWESTTPPGWMNMLPHNLDGSLAGLGSLGDDSYETVSTPSGDYQIVNGTIFDPSGNVVSGIPSSGGALSPSGDLTSILNAASNAAIAATKIYNATQTPSLIPGTNIVYNPATGQSMNASGIPSTQLAPAAVAGLGVGTIAILGVLAVILMSRK